VFSRGAVEEDGENIWKMRRCDQKLKGVEQRSRARKTGGLGRSAGNKSSRPPRIAWGTIPMASYPGTAFRPSDHAGNGLVCVNALGGVDNEVL
jgi:hypothetical protein